MNQTRITPVLFHFFFITVKGKAKQETVRFITAMQQCKTVRPNRSGILYKRKLFTTAVTSYV